MHTTIVNSLSMLAAVNAVELIIACSESNFKTLDAWLSATMTQSEDLHVAVGSLVEICSRDFFREELPVSTRPRILL